MPTQIDLTFPHAYEVEELHDYRAAHLLACSTCPAARKLPAATGFASRFRQRKPRHG